MRWLTSERSTPEPERGATAVTFALFLVVLLTFVGLGVDGAAVFAKKQEVQNGADAAAMALAQAYAVGGCVEDYTMARDYVRANVPGETGLDEAGRARAEKVTCGVDPVRRTGTVRVEAVGVQKPYFMQIANMDPVEVSGAARAEWGSPVAGRVTFPLVFSTCDFEAQGGASGRSVLLLLSKDSPTYGGSHCDYADEWPQSSNDFPGGFGFIVDETGACQPWVSADGWIASDNGNNPPNTCRSRDFPSTLPFTALIPLFDDCKTSKKNSSCRVDTRLPNGGTGSSQYHVEKFASFSVTGYDFNAGIKGGPSCPPSKKPCIQGSFVKYVAIDDVFELGPLEPDSNTVIVQFSE